MSIVALLHHVRMKEFIHNGVLFSSGWYGFVQIDRLSECSSSIGKSRYFLATWICVVHQSQHYRCKGTSRATQNELNFPTCVFRTSQIECDLQIFLSRALT